MCYIYIYVFIYLSETQISLLLRLWKMCLFTNWNVLPKLLLTCIVFTSPFTKGHFLSSPSPPQPALFVTHISWEDYRHGTWKCNKMDKRNYKSEFVKFTYYWLIHWLLVLELTELLSIFMVAIFCNRTKVTFWQWCFFHTRRNTIMIRSSLNYDVAILPLCR
jgi:hypothetical protein